MSTEISHRTVRVAGRRVGYKVAGDGHPVVLIHGLSGSTRWWRHTLPALARHHRVYLVELPGHGRLIRGSPSLPLVDAAAWLLAWMDAAEVQRPHLIGHSMGGYIALRLAASSPAAVDRLVLVDSAGVPVVRSLIQYALPLARAGRYMAPSFLPVLAYDAFRAGPLTLLRSALDLLRQDVREDLRRITAPTLLIWGERDALVPVSVAEMMRREIPESRLVVLAGAGHVPMFERPQDFNRAVLAFLEGGKGGE